MKWHRASKYHLASACGRYTVSRAWMHHQNAWIYDAWSRHTRPATHLHSGAKADCIAACEQHANKQRAAA